MGADRKHWRVTRPLSRTSPLEEFVSQLDVVTCTLLSQILQEDWFERGVELLSNVFDQHPSTKRNGDFQVLEETSVRELIHGKTVSIGFTHVLNELVSLCLRVNHERPSSRVEHDDTVLHGQVITGKSTDRP
jgi:hypothetical protein